MWILQHERISRNRHTVFPHAGIARWSDKESDRHQTSQQTTQEFREGHQSVQVGGHWKRSLSCFHENKLSLKSSQRRNRVLGLNRM